MTQIHTLEVDLIRGEGQYFHAVKYAVILRGHHLGGCDTLPLQTLAYD